ncbi:hypothetical protein DAEQUDRAFT_463036 [Daedalea quercina L-15889]|uniref:Uncharacterized protein n=1 Tax=Daedalea quercina L-15889 TaxID=1314783 RepID=A0A165TE70_9APHY|nr:hypothetical protein DAEQUDRAFT_463036 [Daedalea quercina L-15889]
MPDVSTLLTPRGPAPLTRFPLGHPSQWPGPVHPRVLRACNGHVPHRLPALRRPPGHVPISPLVRPTQSRHHRYSVQLLLVRILAARSRGLLLRISPIVRAAQSPGSFSRTRGMGVRAAHDGPPIWKICITTAASRLHHARSVLPQNV